MSYTAIRDKGSITCHAMQDKGLLGIKHAKITGQDLNKNWFGNK